MNHALAISHLQRSETVGAVEFYVAGEQKDNPHPKINCRLLERDFTSADLHALCEEFNAAIAPVIEKWKKLYYEAALEEMKQ